MYFELGSHDLQVVPTSRLVPVHSYEQVERVWAHDSFNLIDVEGKKDFITRPCSAKIEITNRHVVYAALVRRGSTPFAIRAEILGGTDR